MNMNTLNMINPNMNNQNQNNMNMNMYQGNINEIPFENTMLSQPSNVNSSKFFNSNT